MGDTFKEFLSEKKKRKRKNKKSSRKYAVGGGPAVGQGGMGGDLAMGGDGGGGGESFVPANGSLLRELAQSPYAMTARVLGHTQAGSTDTEQQEQNVRPKPRYCDRCGKRLRKRDRWCSICGEKAPDIRNGTEQQEQEADPEQQNDVPDDEQDEQPDDQTVQPEDELDDMVSPGEQEPEEPQDPDKQGIIRTVDDAHLVYKRQTPDGDYEELWVYNIDRDLKNELEIRRNILAGTDIPQGKTKSDDGSQSYNLVTLGNAQLLHVKGLQN